MNISYDSRPIGIFDSGVGGLTVLQKLTSHFPRESFIYLGDTARVPYGTKSARTVERYTIQVADFLLRQDIKALIAACNTASALGLTALRGHCEKPIIGVIQPGCQAAISALAGRKDSTIGVIGTRATMASRAYPQQLAQMDPTIPVRSLSCPLFVPVVEEGWTHRPSARHIVEESLAPFLENPVSVLILGCTHYPILKPLIRQILGDDTILVDSAEAIAVTLESLFGDVIPPAPPDQKPSLKFFVTDVADRFREVANHFLDDIQVGHVEMIDL